MTSGTPLVRALVIYGICLPLAAYVGWLLANGINFYSMLFLGILLAVIATPFLLKWHHPFLALVWNSAAVAYFLPGRPSAWLLVAAVSLTISILQRALLSGKQFWSPSVVSWSLLVLAAVAVLTAQLNGGVGFRVFGGETYGGKRYLDLLGAIMGYFALTAQRVPPNQAMLYCGLFFLGGVTKGIGSFMHLAPSELYFLFLIFPPDRVVGSTLSEYYLRLGGFGVACSTVVAFLLAKYGLRGIFLSARPWRTILFLGVVTLSLFGGFRSMLIFLVATLFFQFYLEGLFRSKLLPLSLIAMIVGAAVLLPMTRSLPLQIQRALAFLPVDIEPAVRADAEASTEWRLKMWRELWPEVPQHILLGKGFAIDAKEFNKMEGTDRGDVTSGAMLVYDYHNGPLSVVIPLGIWGLIAFLWFLSAAMRVLYANYKFCDPEFKTINTALLAAFTAKIFIFFFVFGALAPELYGFTGLLGLSVSLNGGVCKPVDVTARRPTWRPPTPIPLRPPHPAIAGVHFSRTSQAG